MTGVHHALSRAQGLLLIVSLSLLWVPGEGAYCMSESTTTIREREYLSCDSFYREGSPIRSPVEEGNLHVLGILRYMRTSIGPVLVTAYGEELPIAWEIYSRIAELQDADAGRHGDTLLELLLWNATISKDSGQSEGMAKREAGKSAITALKPAVYIPQETLMSSFTHTVFVGNISNADEDVSDSQRIFFELWNKFYSGEQMLIRGEVSNLNYPILYEGKCTEQLCVNPPSCSYYAGTWGTAGEVGLRLDPSWLVSGNTQLVLMTSEDTAFTAPTYGPLDLLAGVHPLDSEYSFIIQGSALRKPYTITGRFMKAEDYLAVRRRLHTTHTSDDLAMSYDDLIETSDSLSGRSLLQAGGNSTETKVKRMKGKKSKSPPPPAPLPPSPAKSGKREKANKMGGKKGGKRPPKTATPLPPYPPPPLTPLAEVERTFIYC